jgi:hypothetical protein
MKVKAEISQALPKRLSPRQLEQKRLEREANGTLALARKPAALARRAALIEKIVLKGLGEFDSKQNSCSSVSAVTGGLGLYTGLVPQKDSCPDSRSDSDLDEDPQN